MGWGMLNMETFIQFGWNAVGFVAAAFACFFAVAIVWGLFVAIMDALQRWVDKNGWDR
jgi:flagellar biosynthesis protein FliQ